MRGVQRRQEGSGIEAVGIGCREGVDGIALGLGALWAARKQKIGVTTGLVVATVFVMVGIRELARQAYLAPGFSPEALPVQAQYGPFVMFLTGLGVVAAATVWCVTVYRRQAGRG